MPSSHTQRRFTVGIFLASSAVLAGALSFAPVSAQTSGGPEQVGPVKRASKGGPTDSTLSDLAGLPPADARAAAVEQGLAAEKSGRRVVVEVLPSRGIAAAKAAVGDARGVITGGVDGYLVQASVPIGRLVGLERDGRVASVQLPGNVAVNQAPVLTPALAGGRQEHVQKINSLPWRRAGFNGTGIKVGIVDTFDQSIYNSVRARNGSVPTPAGLFCRHRGQPCNIWQYGSGSNHGPAVAETIHDIAPGAQLYLASATTPADLQAAVNYFDAQGVRIISRSQGALYDGPGNGRGAVDSVVDSAVAKGMMWANSAGNSADRRYWRGRWADADVDGWIDFAPGFELLEFACGLPLGFRWSDWGGNRTDYDVYVFDTLAHAQAGIAKFAAEANQPGGAIPIEYLDSDHGFRTCDGESELLAVRLFAPGNGTGNDVMEFSTNLGVRFNFWDVAFSATQPASDSANPGALSVGAVDPPLGGQIGYYSSQGPTNDGRIKPDISAAAGFTSASYMIDGFNGLFNGTSASTPAVAGAAALVLDARPGMTPGQLAGFLKGGARVDRGRRGPDNVFGHGELRLPPPPRGTSGAKPGKPGRIRVLKRGAKKVRIGWGRASRAAWYAVYVRRATASRWRRVGTFERRTVWLRKMRRNTRYVTAVSAGNANGWSGYRYKSFRTKKRGR